MNPSTVIKTLITTKEYGSTSDQKRNHKKENETVADTDTIGKAIKYTKVEEDLAHIYGYC